LNRLVLITGVIIFSILALNLVSGEDGDVVSGSSQSPPPFELQQDGYHFPLDSIGTEFGLDRNPYWPNLKIVSSEVIHLVLEAMTGTISYHIEPVSTTTKTETLITISGLEPYKVNGTSPPIFRHQDGFKLEQFIPDDQDKYTYTQDLAKNHHVYFLSHAATINIWGRDDPRDEVISKTVGTWLNATTCQLTRDVNESIYIQADNITLDGEDPDTGENHSINGTYTGYGIYLNRRRGVTIKNCVVFAFMHDIYLYYSTRNTISQNSISYGGFGVSLAYSTFNTIASNTTYNTHDGIRLYESYYNTVEDNKIYYRSEGAIYLIYSYKNLIQKNTVYVGGFNGIGLYFSTYNTIQDNNVTAWPEAFFLFNYSHNNVVKNNQGRGIRGLQVSFSDNNEIRGNDFSSCLYGMDLASTQSNLITENIIGSNLGAGIQLATGSQNTFSNNTIRANRYGVYLINAGTGESNTFYHNNICNNSLNVYSNQAIELYHPTLLEGNYWGHTEAPGFHRFEIDEPPYDSNAANVVDRYPYLVENGWQIGPPTPLPNQPPECEVISPITGTHLSGTIDITFVVTDTDNDDVKVTVRINGIWFIDSITLTNTAGGVTGTITFYSTSFEDDGHTITIECDDGAGGTSESPGISVTIDNTSPVIFDITIQPDPTNQDPVITATAVDVNAVSDIVDAEFYGDWEIPPEPAPGFAHQMYAVTGFDTPTETVKAIIYISTITEGLHTVWVRAKDAAENWTDPVPSQIFIIDRVPPTITSITVDPDPAGLGDGVTPVITGTLTITTTFSETMDISYAPTVYYDPTGIIGPQSCTLNGIWSTTTYTNDTYAVTNDYEINISTGDGIATVTITNASDLAGNTSVTATTTFVINIKKFAIQNVKAIPSGFNPQFGETSTISYVLSEPAEFLTFELVDGGVAVRTLVDNQPREAGLNYEIWDGLDDFGASVLDDKYGIEITAIGFAGETVGPALPGNPQVEVDSQLVVITDGSDIPYPFRPAPPFNETATIQFTNINTYTPPIDILMSIKKKEVIADIIITDSDVKYDNQGVGAFGSEQWDGTDALFFAGGGTLVNDGLYYYEIAQVGVPPPQRGNSKTGTIVLRKDNTLEKFSDDGKVTVYYNPATPGLVDIDIQTVDPTTLTDEVKAIVTNQPSVYIQSKIYDIIATPPVTFLPNSPALLIFNYDPAIVGDVSETLLLRFWDTALIPPAWADVVPQRIDLINHQIIAEVLNLSLFALFTGADTTPPTITITSPAPIEYPNFTDAQPTVIPITYTAEDPVIDEITSGISYTIVTLNGQVYAEDTIDLSNRLGENTLTVMAIDGSGNVAWKSVRFTVVVPAIVTLKPESLKVNPGVLTAFVELPAGYDVANIIDATCDGAHHERMELSNDGTMMIMKFRRQDIEAALAEKGEEIDIEFVVRGKYKVGQQVYIFKGTDSIKKILPGK